MNTSQVTAFEVLPTDSIQMGAAIGIDADGRAQMLRPGQPFRGFSLEERHPDSADGRLSVDVAFEGVEPLQVDGFQRGDVGKEVWAVGPHSFALDPNGKKASSIGYVVACADYGKALVKFCSAKI